MLLSRLFRRVLAVSALTMSVVCSGAISERPVSSESFATAVSDAQKVANRHAEMQVLRIAGNSMLPFFGDGSVVIVKKIEASQLRAGMVVVYQNRFNETVAHRLINPGATGWTAQGFNNRDADSTPVTDENLVGVVYATLHSNGTPASQGSVASVASNLPIALAAPAK